MGTAPTLQNTVGSAYLGSVAASILFGITILQIFFYYNNYPKDLPFLKICVGALLLLDALHLGLTVHAVYHYLIDEFGNLKAQFLVVWSFKLQIAVNVIIVLLVQSLYAYRIWKLGSGFSKIWPWIVSLSVAGGYAIGIILAVKTYRISTFPELHGMAWVVYASFASSTAIDIVIATAICYYLMKSQSSFRKTNSKISTVMRYVLISGFLTSACSLSALITYATMPDTLVFLGIEFLLTKLYINSYVAMLNARQTVRTTEASSFSMGRIMNLSLSTGSTEYPTRANADVPVISFKPNPDLDRSTLKQGANGSASEGVPHTF